MSQNDLQRCLNNCSEPAVKADKFMQEQMQDLQVRTSILIDLNFEKLID